MRSVSPARVLLLSLLACGCPAPVTTPDGGAARPDAGSPVDGGDPTAPLFEKTHVVLVDVELAPADWETLRNQTRDLFTLLAGDCTAQPFPSPFTTFEGTVTVDGTRLTRATIKKKGFLGSLSIYRPSLKLKFDEYLDGQAVSGLDAMTLNNAQQDPSIVRQCLGYALFAKAGLVAPRCNYAHVRVNGTDLGVYAHVEAIDKDLLRRRFDRPGGNLYEGTLSDFNPTFERTFDLKSTAVDRSDLATVTAALTAPDAELLARLEPLVDVTQFIDFWAMETLLRHWDGYASNTNNFFIYRDPSTSKFVFLPWGADAVFTAGGPTMDNPDGLLLRGELTRRLYQLPETRARYLARVRFMLDTVFDEAALRAEVSRMEALVSPLVHPIQQPQLAGGLANVRRFIDTRRTMLLGVLANPPVSVGAARPSPCLARLGSISATFETTWGTLGAQNPFMTGAGTLDLTLGGVQVPIAYVSSSAGLDTGGNDGPRVGVNIVALLGDGGVSAAAVRLEPALYPSAGAQPFDLFNRIGVTFEFQGQQAVPQGLLGNGTLEFTDAGTADGGRVSGHFAAELYRWPFGG